MKPLLLVLMLAVTAAGCGAEASSSTYTLADGTVYSATDCPAAANLLIGGYDAADALPVKGQTAKARVEEQHDAIQEHLVGSNDVVAVNVIPRNGEVWYRLSNGDYAVELAADYQYEAVLGPSGICPSAPYSVNGVPVVYNRVTN